MWGGMEKEAAEGWRGGRLNMKMELMYQRPKVDYTVATLLAMLPSVWDQQQKEERFIHHGNWCFYYSLVEFEMYYAVLFLLMQ